MKVVKRSGKKEDVNFDKITRRIRSLLKGSLEDIKIIDPVVISQKVISNFKDNMTTTELDNMTADICIQLSFTHPNFAILASRLVVSNHQKNTNASFKEVMNILYNNIYNNESNPLISKEFYYLSQKHGNIIDSHLMHDRDNLIDYFGFKTLYKSYLMKINKIPVERIQHMWMRVSLCIHGDNLDKVFETYDLLSTGYFTHATPTLYHSGMKYQQLISCFLVGTEDSVEGIYQTISDCAHISKWAGGIGVHISNIRGENSYIRKTNGYSDGIIPMLKVYNETAKYINQSQRRNGSFAFYLEPWHPDILDFLKAKLNRGDKNKRAEDLFYALWIPDLFMKYAETGKVWYLLNPSEYPGLNEVYGIEFEELYLKYVDDFKEKIKKNKQLTEKYTINARELWKRIIESQLETGTPYICYKDSVNLKSNQKNIGTIKSSNLCVSGNTFILTKNGYIKIGDYVNEMVDVWNGEIFSRVKIFQTGKNQDMVKVSLSNGAEIICTPYHNFHTKNNGIKTANQLLRCEQLEYFSLPVIQGFGKLKYPYIQGLFMAKGNIKQLNNNLTLLNKTFEENGFSTYNDNIIINIPYITLDIHLEDVIFKNIDQKCILHSYEKDDILKVFFNNKINKLVPLIVPYNYNLESRLRWLEGYIDIIFNESGIKTLIKTEISINIEDKDFFQQFSMLLNSLGLHIQFRNNKNYNEILLTNKELSELRILGFSPKSFNINDVYTPSPRDECIRVKTVVNIPEKMDTFCFNEPVKHKGIFNGILTGNCSEIMEYSDSNEIACCNLASIALPKFLVPPNINDFKNVLLYTIKKCNWCKLAKALFKEFNIKYTESCLKSQEDITKFKEEWNISTFPQVIIDDKLLGNFTTLKEKLSYSFNFTELYKITKIITENLNKIIDINYYPLEKAKRSNINHRPIGIGVQGLADTFAILKIPFGSEESKKLNKEIFETIYYGAIEKSMELAIEYGPYSTYEGSPISQGKFQFDLWKEFNEKSRDFTLTGLWDFDLLRERVLKNGVRNSLLVALMPTASTSQILGNNECFEPFNSCYYLRKTLAGEFPVINKYLLKDLINCNLWNQDIRNKIIYNRGSIQNIKEIPQFLKEIYKTVWEIKQRIIIEMSFDRSHYVCQSQSLNIHFENPTNNTIYSMHFDTWKKGLKTGMYYLRTKPIANSQQFTIDPKIAKKIEKEQEEGCDMCGS